jgi:hypothetical protein
LTIVSFVDKELSEEGQKAIEQLRESLPDDFDAKVALWRATLSIRRGKIRSSSTIQVLQDFPGYHDCLLVEFFSSVLDHLALHRYCSVDIR